MKIRIKGDSIRLRLSQSEVAEIGAGNKVFENTHFSDSVLGYVLKSHTDLTPVKAFFQDNQIEISINHTVANTWANSDQVGVTSSEEVKPSILIEKDFQCLTGRPGEDESDMFQNPNTVC